MADGAALLRMLEPTVRPVQTPTTGGAAPQAPLEQRSFDSLLAEARESAPASEEGGGATPAATGANEGTPGADATTAADANRGAPLSALHGLEQVENASLRRLMAQAAPPPASESVEAADDESR